MLKSLTRYITLPARMLGKLVRGEKLFVQVLSKESWDRDFQSGRWDQLHSKHLGSGNMAVIAHLLLFLSDNKSKRLLDVGCGNGALLRTLESLRQQFEYVGTDISSVALNQLSKAHPSATTICTNMLDVDTIPGDFDFVLFSECLYYVDYEAAVQRYRTKVRPNGFVIVSMHGRGSRRILWSTISRHFNEVLSFTIRENQSDTQWTIKAYQYR